MIDLKHCTELGSITKTHGVQGQVALHTNSFENIESMEWVFIEQDGLPVPFFVSEFRETTAEMVLLTLDDVFNQDAASELINSKVWIPREALSAAEPSLNLADSQSCIGYTVIDQQLGELGILDAILDFDQNPLLQVKNGRTEILIPLQSEFILDIDDRSQTIRVNTPEGLVDLY